MSPKLTTTQNKNRIYELFPDHALIGLKVGAASVGFAEKTARNMLTDKTFPVKTVLRGGRRLIDVDDLARYYAKLVGLDEPPPEPSPEPPPPPEPTPAAANRRHPEACPHLKERGAA